MQYLGQQYDESTKLYNMRARYMSSDTGRFISMDAYQGSIYDPASLHKYTYTSGNPVMYQDVSGYSQNLISNAVGMAGKCILIEGETVYNTVVIGMFSAIVASITYAVSIAASKLAMTMGTYMKEVCTANFTYITGAEKSIEDMIIIFPAAEVANDIEIFPETENVPVWEILTVPPAKGTDVMITIPGTVDVPNGIIIDFPVTQSVGLNILLLEWKLGDDGVGNSVQIEGRGSTGRTIPNTLSEQMAMHQVKSNPLEGAIELPFVMNDPRWLASEGWVKMQNVVRLSDGTKITIHFVYNKITGAFDDFKFKN